MELLSSAIYESREEAGKRHRERNWGRMCVFHSHTSQTDRLDGETDRWLDRQTGLWLSQIFSRPTVGGTTYTLTQSHTHTQFPLCVWCFLEGK